VRGTEYGGKNLIVRVRRDPAEAAAVRSARLAELAHTITMGATAPSAPAPFYPAYSPASATAAAAAGPLANAPPLFAPPPRAYSLSAPIPSAASMPSAGSSSSSGGGGGDGGNHHMGAFSTHLPASYGHVMPMLPLARTAPPTATAAAPSMLVSPLLHPSARAREREREREIRAN
jgi:hypothetical protein